MREFFKYFICLFIFCSSLNAIIPIPLPVTDVKAIQQTTKLGINVGTLSASANLHWNAKERHWQSDTNKFYYDAIEKYKKILEALKNKNIKIDLQKIRENSEKIDEMALKLLGKRDYAELVPGSLAANYEFEIILNYCDEIKDKNRKLACFNDLAAAGNKLGMQQSANKIYTELTEKIGELNTKRTDSKDVKSSIDVNNAIRQSFLELDLGELEKEINEITADEKYDLENQSATNLTLKNINTKVDMGKIVKAK